MACVQNVIDLTSYVSDSPMDQDDNAIALSDDDDDDSSFGILAISSPQWSHSLPLDLLSHGLIELPFLSVELYNPTRLRTGGPPVPLATGDTVEVAETSPCGLVQGHNDFFKIKDIILDLRTEDYYLRGWRYSRVYRLDGKLDLRNNEVHRVLETSPGDSRAPAEQGLCIIPLSHALRKRHLIMTNTTWPEHATQDDLSTFPPLVCRWDHILKLRPHASSSRNCISEQRLQRLSGFDADAAFRVDDLTLTRLWLGFIPKAKARLTFADAFCGAGGASLGALHAGLKVKWAFDMDENATETFYQNFLHTAIFHASVDLFLKLQMEKLRVDILHVSTPCQAFSPANTRHNPALDELNQAVQFAVQELIQHVKPRLVTMEQTYGVVTHHPAWFNRLVNMLTSLGYSVRWKVAHLNRWGLCQDRKRLIIYAACPGGVLPEFPAEMNGPGTGRPYATVATALASLQTYTGRIPNHEVRIPRTWISRPPYSANSPLRGAITCGGGDVFHPSGRPFTVRELALLQGFTVNYVFPENQTITALRRQIGNAWPAVAAAKFLRQARLALQQEDRDRNLDPIDNDITMVPIVIL